MNREMKRMMQRQGQVDADGSPTRKEAPRPPAARVATKERIGPSEYARQVRAELRKVAWPTRNEVINYSLVVLITLALLITLIFFLDLAFAKSVLWLFDA